MQPMLMLPQVSPHAHEWALLHRARCAGGPHAHEWALLHRARCMGGPHAHEWALLHRTRPVKEGWRRGRRQLRLVFVLLLLLLSLAACSPGQAGETLIAFIRDGQLWTIGATGSNAYPIVSTAEPVIGYSWSPDHRLLAFRQLAKGVTRQPAGQPVTGQRADATSTLNTIGLDGGTPITIALSTSGTSYNNPFWIPNGTRLLYRLNPQEVPVKAEEAGWWVSQNDQPVGIAAKALPSMRSLPSVDSANQRIIGISNAGIFSTTLTGTEQRYLLSTALSSPDAPLLPTLERALWQPTQAQPAILYASIPDPKKPETIQLQLRQEDGTIQPLTTCQCTQFAWSPDGTKILYSAGQQYTLLTLKDRGTFTIQPEPGSVPYWSPDGRFLLLDGPHTLQIVQPETRQQSTLLSDGKTTSINATQGEQKQEGLVQAVPNSLWASDSRHFLFLTRERLQWQGQALDKGNGLYTIAINETGQVQGKPEQVSNGNISEVGWSYQNPATSFLY